MGTCRLFYLWSIMRGNDWGKRRHQSEYKEGARGFMCNSCLQNWPLCSMSFISNFLKNTLVLQYVLMIVLVDGINNLVYIEQVELYLYSYSFNYFKIVMKIFLKEIVKCISYCQASL